MFMKKHSPPTTNVGFPFRLHSALSPTQFHPYYSVKQTNKKRGIKNIPTATAASFGEDRKSAFTFLKNNNK